MGIVYYALVVVATLFLILAILAFLDAARKLGGWRTAFLRLAIGLGCAGAAVLLLGRALPVVDGLAGTSRLFEFGVLLMVGLAALVLFSAVWEFVAFFLVLASAFGFVIVGVNAVRDVFVQKEPMEVAVEFMRSGRGKFCLADSASAGSPSGLLSCQVGRLQPAVDSLSGSWGATGVGQFSVRAEDVFIHDNLLNPPEVWIVRREVGERTDTSARAVLSGHYGAGMSNNRVSYSADVTFTATVTLVLRDGRWFVRELTATR